MWHIGHIWRQYLTIYPRQRNVFIYCQQVGTYIFQPEYVAENYQARSTFNVCICTETCALPGHWIATWQLKQLPRT
jgi:hypothetical protein